jgi:drug/metabolite transporter (DMT)-like permease
MSLPNDFNSLDEHGRERHGLRGILIVTLLPVIWGTTFPVVKFALKDASPMAFNVIRFGMTVVGFLICSRTARSGLRMLLSPVDGRERRVMIDSLVLGVTLGIGYSLQVFGLLTTSSSKSAFITSTSVIWTPIFAIVLGREKFSLKLLGAILITVVGILLLTHPYRGSTGFVIGDILTIGSALSFSVYIIWVDRALPNAIAVMAVGDDAAHRKSSVLVTSNQLIVATLLMALALPFETFRFSMTMGPLGGAIYTAIFATALTAYLQARYQHAVSPSSASIIFMLEPVTAALIGYFFLMERMGTEEVVGALLIVMGVIVAQLRYPTAAIAAGEPT